MASGPSCFIVHSAAIRCSILWSTTVHFVPARFGEKQLDQSSMMRDTRTGADSRVCPESSIAS